MAFLLTCLVASAQNTKGDRPAESNKKQKRETRFKTKSKQGDRAKTKDIAGRRLRTKNKSSANKANASFPTPRTATRSPRVGQDRVGKASRPVVASTPRTSEQNYSGKPPRKRVAVRSATARVSKSNVYPSRTLPRSVSFRTSRSNVYTGRYQFKSNPSPRPRDTQKAYTRTASGKKVKVRSVTSQVKRQNIRRSSGGEYRNFRSTVVQRPVSNRSTIARAKRLSKPPVSFPKGKTTVTPRSASRSFIRNKSLNPYAGFFRVKRKGEQVTTRDLAGRPLLKKNFHSQPIIVESRQDSIRNKKPSGERSYRGPSGSYKSATRTSPRAWRGDVAGRKVRGRNAESTSRLNNSGIYPPGLARPGKGDHPDNKALPGSGFKSFTSRYVGKVGEAIPVRNPNKKANKLGRYQQKLKGTKPYKGGGSVTGRGWNNNGQPLGPRKADAFGVRYSGNLKTGKPYKGGGSVSGRLWNNQGRALSPSRSDARGVQYSGNIKSGKPFKGGGSVSGKLWNNQGRPLGPSRADARGVKYSGNIKTGKPYKGGGSVSGRLWNNQGHPLDPSRADARGVKYSGNIKTGKPYKGGGSVSGKLWNNQGHPLDPSRADARGVEYSGNIKTGKPYKGGGSVSGKLWNNQGRPIDPSRRDARGVEYSGNIKTGKPYKGGGSVSGKLWNNQGRPIDPSRRDARGVEYSGNIKTGKPYKGGGSVSGKLWNNQERPIDPSKRDAKGVEFSGNIKTGRPQKGGGSISGSWNNNGQPIPARIPSAQGAAKVGGYPGKFKKIDLVPTMVNQGEEFTGFLKAKRYKNYPYQHSRSLAKKENKMASKAGGLQVAVKQPGWARNKNAHDDALLKRDPGHGVFRTDGLQIRVQSPGYTQNKNAHESSILKRRQSAQTFATNKLTAKMKQPGWARNKNAHEDALMKRDPGHGVFRTDDIYGRVKAYSYKANPSSSKTALHVREPGKAFAKAANYQGNIKMQKFNFLKHPDYHPDASFVKNNKNNVKEERSLLTNIRLLWAKVFRKNETQPEVVKEKVRKPRYDRREIGIWYD